MDLSFRKVREMMKELLEKGYKEDELLDFPITVGAIRKRRFVEFNEIDTGFKIVLPVDKILSISIQQNNKCFIETGVDSNGDSLGFYAKQSYDEIKKLLVSSKDLEI